MRESRNLGTILWPIPEKNSMQLRRYRELGNQAFVKGMDWKALELYNEAVCQAPREQSNTKEQV